MLPNLQQPTSVPSFCRKRPHCLLGFSSADNDLLLEDGIELQPDQKHARTEVCETAQLTTAQVDESPITTTPTNSPEDVEMTPAIDEETGPATSSVFCGPETTTTTTELDELDALDDSEEGDEPSSSSTLNHPQLIFKVPLVQLLTPSPRESFLKENPWLEESCSDKAIVVWQPSPFETTQNATQEENGNSEAKMMPIKSEPSSSKKPSSDSGDNVIEIDFCE